MKTYLFSFFFFISSLLLAEIKEKEDMRQPSQTNYIQLDSQKIQEISVEELKHFVDEPNPYVSIVDTRGKQEDEGSRIPSAKPIPYDASWNNITSNLNDKNATIIVYNQNDECPSSCYLARRLTEAGYQNVFHLKGGLNRWIQAGYPIEQGIAAKNSFLQESKRALPNPNYLLENKK